MKKTKEELSEEELLEESLNLILGKTKNSDIVKQIAWEVFLEPLNEPKTFEKIDSEEYYKRKKTYSEVKRRFTTDPKKFKHRKSLKFSLNTSAIHTCFNHWKSSNFLNQKIIFENRKGKSNSTYTYPHKLYQFNLNPLFVYLENTLKNYHIDGLTSEEKNVLSFLFFPQPVRTKLYREYKNEDFITAMLIFYVKYYFIPYLKNPKISNKKYSGHEQDTRTNKLKNITINNEFDREYLKLVIFGERPKKVKIDNENISNKSVVHFKDIPVVERKLTKEELLLEKENDKINLFDGLYTWFDNNVFMEFNHKFYLGHYASLHKYFPDIINSLDLKIGKVQGIL